MNSVNLNSESTSTATNIHTLNVTRGKVLKTHIFNSRVTNTSTTRWGNLAFKIFFTYCIEHSKEADGNNG